MNSVLRFVKRAVRISGSFKVSHVLNGLMVFGIIGAGVLCADGTSSYGDMATFIENNVLIEPSAGEMGDLGAFIKSLPKDAAPVIVVSPSQHPSHQMTLSDGKFETLSASWKRGVYQVVHDGRCQKVATAFMQGMSVTPLLQQAHAIVESNCDTAVVGAAGEVGIFQVMPTTCSSMGVRGDYRDPVVSARCTEKYRHALCDTVHGTCSARLMFLAHNRGIRGALATARPASTEYVRKVDCAERVLLGKVCA